MHVGFDRPHRLLDDELDANGGGKVEHDVCPVDKLGEQGFVLDRLDAVLESGPVLQVPDVVD